MLKLKYLEFANFRSFMDLTSITFPDQGLILISGENSVTGTSSGAGKSTILMAIAYALGLINYSSRELANWNSNKKPYVFLQLEKDDGTIIKIIRNPGLSVEILDPKAYYVQTAQGVEAEKQLNKYIGIPSAILKALTYREQRQDGSFLFIPDGQKKDFLMEILNLNIFETALSSFKDEVARLESSLGDLAKEKEFLQNNLNTLTYQLKNINYVNSVDILKAQLAEKQEQYQKLQNSNNLEYLDVLNELKGYHNMAGNLKKELLLVEKELSDIDKQISFLKEEKKCPTCLRPFEVNELLDKAVKAHAQKMADKNKLIELEKYLLNQINQSLANLPNPIQISLLNDFSQIITKAQIEAQKHQAELNNLKNEITYLEQTIEKANESAEMYRALKQQEEMLIQRLNWNEENKQKKQEELRILGHSQQIVGKQGFLSVIFDELLKEIEVCANQMLQEFPNMSGLRIEINNVTQTKNSTKSNISINVIKQNIVFPYKLLSGGQLCALDLVLDLAIVLVIRRRIGMHFNWIALDEALDGLDAAGKTAALQLIKQVVPGLVLVIDHQTEFKEIFDKTINVTYDGMTSVLRTA